MITARTPTGDKGVSVVTVRTPTGDKAVATMTLRTAPGDKEFYSSAAMADLSATVNPLTATGSTFSATDADVTTNLVTVTVTGGTAPYSIVWDEDLGGSGTWSITASLAFSTRFTATLVPPSTSVSTSFTGTVTDARGRTGTVTVPAIAYNLGDF